MKHLKQIQETRCVSFRTFVPGSSRCRSACSRSDCCLDCKFFPKYCKSKVIGKVPCPKCSFLIRRTLTVWRMWWEELIRELKALSFYVKDLYKQHIYRRFHIFKGYCLKLKEKAKVIRDKRQKPN